MKFREIETFMLHDEPLMFMVEHVAGEVQDPIDYYYLANKIADEEYLLAPLSRRIIRAVIKGDYTMGELFSNNPYGWCVIATYVCEELTKKRVVSGSKLASMELTLRDAKPPKDFIKYLKGIV